MRKEKPLHDIFLSFRESQLDKKALDFLPFARTIFAKLYPGDGERKPARLTGKGSPKVHSTRTMLLEVFMEKIVFFFKDGFHLPHFFFK